MTDDLRRVVAEVENDLREFADVAGSLRLMQMADRLRAALKVAEDYTELDPWKGGPA